MIAKTDLKTAKVSSLASKINKKTPGQARHLDYLSNDLLSKPYLQFNSLRIDSISASAIMLASFGIRSPLHPFKMMRHHANAVPRMIRPQPQPALWRFGFSHRRQ